MPTSLVGKRFGARAENCPPTTQYGFTLIEMIVTVTILALAASFTLPSFQSGLPHWRLRGAVRDLATLLKYARNQSVVSLRPLHVVLDKSRNLYWLDHADAPAADDPSLSGTRTVRIYVLPDGVSFGQLAGGVVPVNAGRERILFFPPGNSSGGLVGLHDTKGLAYTIKVDPLTGLTRIARSSR